MSNLVENKAMNLITRQGQGQDWSAENSFKFKSHVWIG